MSETLKKITSRPLLWAFALVAASAFAVLLVTYVRVYSPAYGITRFISIGREFNRRGIAVYRATPKYMDPYPPDRWGFDGQYYAEIALDPLLRDPQLKTAIDDPQYRSHRIFLSWLAWLGGLGSPVLILNVYAALNGVFWLAYAAILFVLFRPYRWAGLCGFAAMLLTCGVVESTYRSLTDFPAFVLMTLAAMIGGLGGAGMLAMAALTREVSGLGLAGLVEFKPPWGRAVMRNLLIGLIVGGPVLIWFAYVAWRLPVHTSMVGDNIDWPLRAIFRRFGDAMHELRQRGFGWRRLYRKGSDLHALLTIVATLTQCAYVLAHPQWKSRLWRIGAAFVPFFVCVSSNVWDGDGYFTATRHALPITLAFNLVLAMRPGRLWPLWFLLGNCFVPAGVCDLVRFGRETPQRVEYVVEAPPPIDASLGVRYQEGWSIPEWNARHTWRWAVAQNAALVLTNSSRQPLEVQFTCTVMSLLPRDLTISVNGRQVWLGRLDQKPQSVAVRTLKFVMPPGETKVSFSTPQPTVFLGPDDPRDKRPLAFTISDLALEATQATGPGR